MTKIYIRRKIDPTKSLLVMSPDAASEWHPTKNGDLTPDQFTSRSGWKVWWKCKEGHEWETIIANRTKGHNCPICWKNKPKTRKPSKLNSITTKFPHLVKEWHPTKNGDLTPDQFSFGSNKKVWWRCKEEHEWEASIANRSKGRGCYQCSKNRPRLKKVTYKSREANYSLAISHPALINEWHPTKNGDLTPDQFSFGQDKKVWWKCKNGHEWEARINSRTKGVGCNFCKLEIVNLEKNYPELILEWHPTKNLHKKPKDFTQGSNKKVWWKCKNGHEWETAIVNRTNRKSNCPLCTNQTSKPELRILSELKLFYEVASRYKINGIEIDIFIPLLKIGIEYDGSYYHENKLSAEINKNNKLLSLGIHLIRVREFPLKKINEYDIELEKSGLVKNTLNKIILHIHSLSKIQINEKIDQYLKENNFKNTAIYKEYVSFFPSPIPEHSLTMRFPDLVKEWNIEKNFPLISNNFSYGSGEIVWWICAQGHEYQAAIHRRTQGIACPFCSGHRISELNSLATKFPHLVKEWHPTKNGDLTPDQFSFGSNKKVWWKCKEGHEWEAPVSNRSFGYNCPFCSGRNVTDSNSLSKNYPNLVKEWHPTKNGNLTPDQFSFGSNKKVWWKCKEGHEWEASIPNRTSKGSGCPFCSGRKK